METFFDRLVVEEKDLSIKVSKLDNYVEGNTHFRSISKMQQVLLVTQLNVMKIYLYTLQERIFDISKNE